jgi:hypothetical protein
VTGLAATSETTETKVKVDALILGDRHIISEICVTARIVKPAIVTISGELSYRKVCARECRKAHCRIQNSPGEGGGHLCRTSPARWQGRRCFSVKKSYETLVHH